MPLVSSPTFLRPCDSTTAATMYPTWVTANTGNLPQKTTSTKLTFNPSTGVLSATSFTGAGTGLTGTAASLTAGTASAVAVGGITGLGTGVATAAANNLSAAGGITTTIASGTAVLGTSLIGSAACASAVTVAATNVATTDTVTASFNGDPTGVTGYVPLTTGMLAIIGYPTSGNVNFKVCNNTSAGITPGAITLNWRVTR